MARYDTHDLGACERCVVTMNNIVKSIQKCRTHAQKTTKTACVKIIMLKIPLSSKDVLKEKNVRTHKRKNRINVHVSNPDHTN